MFINAQQMLKYADKLDISCPPQSTAGYLLSSPCCPLAHFIHLVQIPTLSNESRTVLRGCL